MEAQLVFFFKLACSNVYYKMIFNPKMWIYS